MYPEQQRRTPSGRAVAALVAVLPAGTRTEVIRESPGRTVLRLVGSTAEVAWLERGWPREVRQVLQASTVPDVVAAPVLSPGARRLLDDSGTSWVDESGDAQITLADVVVVRRSAASPRAVRPRASRWNPTLQAVCEALLVGTPGTGQAVSRATGLSLAGCLTALKRLADEGLLVSAAARGPGSARTVVDPDELLDRYARAVDGSVALPSLSVGVLWRDPLREVSVLGARWDELGTDWAVTSALAAAVTAPVQTAPPPWGVCVGVTTPAQLESLASSSGLRPVEGGGCASVPSPRPGQRPSPRGPLPVSAPFRGLVLMPACEASACGATRLLTLCERWPDVVEEESTSQDFTSALLGQRGTTR